MKDGRGNVKGLITFILLDYGHRFMGRLYIVDSKLWTCALSVSLIHRVLKCNYLSIVGC